MTWEIEYFARPNGRQPLAKWRDEQPKDVRSDIDAKRVKLANSGLDLLGTRMLKRIGRDLYELRGVKLKWRIAVHFDSANRKFVLLNGWRKQKQRHERDIEEAQRLLSEYLEFGR